MAVLGLALGLIKLGLERADRSLEVTFHLGERQHWRQREKRLERRAGEQRPAAGDRYRRELVLECGARGRDGRGHAAQDWRQGPYARRKLVDEDGACGRLRRRAASVWDFVF